MNVGELCKRLSLYPDELEVMVFEDYGSGYLISPVTNLIELSEFRNEVEEEQVVICFGEEEDNVGDA